ncbi:flagellar hook assembly protein FlgD [Aestuariivita sp.]|jgi:flagellar basal-body rod modification protein FlgD|uniref:flagellar hook assembly protein FlgD n=1 Tax=Aestuariivita sp. TaxID=1872407 RepID=UPI00216B7E45|nr:flagellar hook assembly protein FlgD [Aestuariivita sp.]MCE8008957.1 flagellar hook assembly protein FlgD [Aestuariivita sp.]
MDIAATNQTAATASSSGTAAQNQLEENYTTFLQLLTAQISNQDPLEPMDSSTFVTQLAQLTQVEQTAQTNVSLASLSAKLDSMALISGANLVGQEGNFPSGKIILEADGGTMTYRVGATATEVKAEIYDPTGQLVRTIENLPGEIGTEHDLEWDGLTDTKDAALTGVYTIKLTAATADGDAVQTALFRDAEIQEVNLAGGQLIYLMAGDEYVASGNIRSVR